MIRATLALAAALQLTHLALADSNEDPRMSQSQATAASKVTDGVHKARLGNGLTVLIREDRSQPVVAIVTWVKTGYFHESDDEAGISHVMEHMFFNGTKSRPGSEDISRETKAIGGSLNAGTIYDRTSYYVVLPSENWQQGLAIQADAFANPLLDPKVLEKELQAILQEARRKLDNPSAFAREKLYELAFSKHRMRRWRIGQEDVLRDVTADKLRRYYEDHYRPQNTILSVVGDVSTQEVLAEVEKLYGGIEKGHLRQRTGPSEPAQREFRSRRLQAELTRNYNFFGFHTPGAGHEDNAALDVLANVLGGGQSSRLNRRLKEELGVVTSAMAGVYQFGDVGMFDVTAVCSFDDQDRAVREIIVEIEKLKEFGIDDSEIERARGMLRTARAMELEEVLGQANTLAYYEARGDYRLVDEEHEQLLNVTADDVQRVARKYLTIDNGTLLEYVPQFLDSGREPHAMREHLMGYVLASAPSMQLPAPVAAGATVLPRADLDAWSERFAQAARQTPEGHIEKFQLANGATLLVKSNHRVPTVAVGAYFRGGRVEETTNRAGITRLLQRIMVKETEHRTAEQLAGEIEALGSAIGRVSTDDYYGFTLGGLSENLPAAFDVLFDVLRHPVISAEHLEREREATLSAIQGIEDSSSSLAYQFLRSAMFQEHPYGHPEMGGLGFLKIVQPDRLRQHYEEVIRPQTLVLTVVGDVEPQLVREFVGMYLDAWNPQGEQPPTTADEFYSKERLESVPALLSPREGGIDKDRAQSALYVGFRTVPRGHEDELALELLANITGGLGGTFFEEIRTKRGLAYQVSSFDVSNRLAGYWGNFVACSPDSAAAVQELLLDLIAGLSDSPPDEASLQRAQGYLAGSHVVASQRNAAQLGELVEQEIYGLPLENLATYPQRIRAITRDDLQRVAERYLRDKPFALGVVRGKTGRTATPGS